MEFRNEEKLNEAGLTRVIKYVVLLLSDGEWHTRLVDDENEAIKYRGYGDFAGYSKVTCIVPLPPEEEK